MGAKAKLGFITILTRYTVKDLVFCALRNVLVSVLKESLISSALLRCSNVRERERFTLQPWKLGIQNGSQCLNRNYIVLACVQRLAITFSSALIKASQLKVARPRSHSLLRRKRVDTRAGARCLVLSVGWQQWLR